MSRPAQCAVRARQLFSRALLERRGHHSAQVGRNKNGKNRVGLLTICYTFSKKKSMKAPADGCDVLGNSLRSSSHR